MRREEVNVCKQQLGTVCALEDRHILADLCPYPVNHGGIIRAGEGRREEVNACLTARYSFCLR